MLGKYTIYFISLLIIALFNCSCSSKDNNNDEMTAAAALLALSQSSTSSASAIVTGSITDSSSTALKSATLTVSTTQSSVRSVSTRASVDSSVTTDDYGFFTLNLSVTTYYITVKDSSGTQQGKFSLTLTSTTDTPTASVTSGSITVNALRSVASSTGAATYLVFYPINNSGSGFGSGSLGGRSGADTYCSNQKPSALTSCSSVAALLSFSSSDQVSNMPTVKGFSGTIPIKAWNGSSVGDQVVSKWSSMLSTGTVFSPILSTAFSLSNTPYVMTGTSSDGTVDSSNNCSGFTSNSGSSNLDAVDMTNGTFAPEAGNCSDGKDASSNNLYMICVCY
ncbi:MAG: carboxypeptidase regulatory-like domain-containing protein [Leptospiraceae bacterium]|nr:carboxypeptidase regulatory-like domain-containing protein [Leptospiraceae bacterium]MCP5495373.1 carboxypeptidase regulatory-like domain-containing protein [Leptospiraceae bacterium]